MMNIGHKLQLVVIEPKNKNEDKFKTMEEEKTSLQKPFCPSQNKVSIKKIIKREKRDFCEDKHNRGSAEAEKLNGNWKAIHGRGNK